MFNMQPSLQIQKDGITTVIIGEALETRTQILCNVKMEPPPKK